MRYIDNIEGEKGEYLGILVGESYPYFIDRYIRTKVMQRLAGIDLFCGMGYTNLDLLQTKYPYSRLDHSIACALITWRLTKDKKQTLVALFHDLGTPAFSHAVDFMLGDSEKQVSSERNIGPILQSSGEILHYLEEDNVDVAAILDPPKYPIVDNSKEYQTSNGIIMSRFCVDRAESVLIAGLIWGKFWDLDNIRKLCEMLIVVENEDGEPELGLTHWEGENDFYGCEHFFGGILDHAVLLQKPEDRLALQLLGDILKKAIKEGVISTEDLYKLSEQKIIDKFLKSHLSELWKEFSNLSVVSLSGEEIPGRYCANVPAKVRVCDPLFVDGTRVSELSDVSRYYLHRYCISLQRAQSGGRYVVANISLETIYRDLGNLK